MKTLARADCLSDVRRRLRTLRFESTRRWGRMSAHQMVCHLADGYRMATGEKAVAPYGGLFHRTALKWIVLYGPLRWPAGVPTSPELDQRCAGTQPSAFGADVAELERLIELISARAEGLRWPAHPMFGPMSRTSWLRWGYLHADHHLRQFGA